MFKRRLLALAALLRTVPPEQFNMRYWVGDSWKGKPTLSCGTSACALGWATTMPSLRRVGLRLYRRANDFGDLAGHVKCLGARPRLFEDETEKTAARVVFGLDGAAYDYLFIPGGGLGGDATAEEKADQIEEFVRAGMVLPEVELGREVDEEE